MCTCTNCGKENEDHYKFCLGCGANLESQRTASSEGGEHKFCPSCGGEITSGQRFCGSCGFRLDGDAKGGKVDPKAKPAAGAKPAEPPPKPAEPPPKPAAKKAERKDGPSPASLVMVKLDGSAGDEVPLQLGDNSIGRTCGEPVFERDPYLSPAHANFAVGASSIAITDLGSLNGVYYRITEITEVHHGDWIRVGHEVLRFLLLDADEPVVPGPGDGTVAAGSPPMGAWGKLERLSAPGEASLTFLLRGAEMHLGRERGDILFRDDGYVSGKHARIYQDSGKYFIEDLKSSNGTFMRIRGAKTVTNGALLLLGQQPFRVAFK